MDNKIIGNNCYGIMLNSSEYSKKNLLHSMEYHQVALDISIINGLILTNLIDHKFCEGIYKLNDKGLVIEYFNTRYTSTEFRIYTDDPENAIISGKIGLASNKDIIFNYYKPDIMNIASLHPDDDDLERKIAKLQLIKMILEEE